MNAPDKWNSLDIAQHSRQAQRIVAKCRDVNASHEAIVRAALNQVAYPAALEILGRLHLELLHKQQEATHNAPIGTGGRT